VREARLVPVVNFKGRAARPEGSAAPKAGKPAKPKKQSNAKARQSLDDPEAADKDDKVDGGLDQ
jgi:hypothetical protein